MASETVRDIHHRAMALAEEAWFASRESGHTDPKAMDLYRQAADVEKQALDRVRDIPNNEPTFSILEQSWKSLDLLGQGKVEEARALETGRWTRR